MEASFWHERWAKNEIGFHEKEFNPLLTRHFHKLALPAQARVFVPLCGKTRDIAWLLQAGYSVVGIELSETAIQQLVEDLGTHADVVELGPLKRYHAPGLELFVGDIFDLSAGLLGHVDAVYDRAALVALPPAMRARYTEQLRLLTGAAPQLLVCFDYDQSKMPGPPHAVPASEVFQHYGAHYTLTLTDALEVAGGLKGKCEAHELVWLLRKP